MKRTILSLPPVLVIAPAVLSADVTSPTIDLIDAAANELLIAVGIGGITFTDTNRLDVKVTHSNDDVTYVPVVQTDVIINGDDDTPLADPATGNVRAVTVAKPAGDVTRVAYIGGRRYLKVFLDFAGTHGTGTPVSVTLAQALPHLAGKA